MNPEPTTQTEVKFLTARIAIAAMLILGISIASASVQMIEWDNNGEFRHSAEVESGGFAEICGSLSSQEQVDWSFEASDKLDFNIHYHQGDEVVYPAEVEAVAELADLLFAPIDQTYCWMWTNQQSFKVSFTLVLSLAAEAVN